MEREAVPIERRAQLAVAHSRLHRHRPRRAIERHDRVHLAQREKMVGAVSNPVEAVPGAEHLEVRVLSDELLDLRERRRRRDAVGAVPIVASPIAQRLGLRGLSRGCDQSWPTPPMCSPRRRTARRNDVDSDS